MSPKFCTVWLADKRPKTTVLRATAIAPTARRIGTRFP